MEEKKKKELSYEELQERCGDLFQSLQRAHEEIRRIDAANAIQRLNFLFKVLENYAHFDPDFIDKCVAEIKDILTIEEEVPEQKEDSHDA